MNGQLSRPNSAATDDVQPPAEDPAPPAGRGGAFAYCRGMWSRPQSDDQSRPKHRFMAALLDKMRSPQDRDQPSPGATDCSLDSQVGSQMDSQMDSQASGHNSTDPHHRRLEDTHPSYSPAVPMTFTYAPGSKPLPQYTIRRGIGIGGFGEVYFALSDAGKEVALKRIQRNLDVEIRGASQCLNLKHPNLVSLFDICRDSADQAWIVMEYVAGLNLRQVLDQNPKGLSEAEARRWFAGLAAGVGHLHSAGLVHRDLKPGNVFDDLGVVKVGDYGLSKFISASHRGGHTESVGTFHYMAPEIGRGEYGREIDIYALGIILFELLTGEVPFDGESCHEIIVKHLTATPDLSAVANPYRSVIARALHKDPAKRQASVHEMLLPLGLVDASKDSHLPIAESETEPIAATVVREPVARFVEPRSSMDAAAMGAAAINGHAQPEFISPPGDNTDEPLARAIRESVSDLKRWWKTLDESPGAKTFLLVAAVFVLIVNTSWLLPLLSLIAVFYVPYYVIRHMVLQVRQQPTYAQAQRIASAAGSRPLTRQQWRDYMRTDLRARPSIHRVAELNTSWIAATLTAIGMTIGAGVIGLHSDPVNAVALAPYGWMMIVVLLGSLGILGMGKLWERDEGESLPRRLVMAGVGAAVGVAAYSVYDFLMLPANADLARDIDTTRLPQALYNADGSPLPAAMMVHFAVLFAGLRWWKPVDPLRRTRLSLWSVAVAVVGAWAVHQFVPIPQPFGMLAAGGIAIAIQMSAPWIDPRAKLTVVSDSPYPARPGTKPAQPRTGAPRDLSPRSIV